ncbi:isoprenylcysteine carboxylmethyltransferase family protein [Vibrio sp. TH_r3]|uniref:methyltransferase family protein n=1 Tax=Vibrio sp. TH_r3 TaxID=3082084 RepID=UPI0029532826|nr:isoprenylcysteine carboxylmethyltransferase family protein [Vibrio sp. TH_r3]MDV7104309.1 isoprenylcysteine carboxylmethyltransferase family protein [Vibrio sp. TH_r3]
MRALELKVPPVVVFLLCLFVMYWINTISTAWHVYLPMPYIVGAVCFCASGYFGLSGIMEFSKAKTSVHPVNINKTTTVVNSGVYKISRNPMYFGLLLLLFAFAYVQQNMLSFLVCAAFVLYMNRFQIRVEEKHLQQKFGADYLDYKQKVRRWI